MNRKEREGNIYFNTKIIYFKNKKDAQKNELIVQENFAASQNKLINEFIAKNQFLPIQSIS